MKTKTKTLPPDYLPWVLVGGIALLLLAINPLKMMPWGSMMGGYGGVGCFGGGGLGTIASLLLIIVLVLAAVWLGKQISGRRQ